jgi:hypothetical protein
LLRVTCIEFSVVQNFDGRSSDSHCAEFVAIETVKNFYCEKLMTRFDISWSLITDEALKVIAESSIAGNLISLNIQGSRNITDKGKKKEGMKFYNSGVEYLAVGCKNLEEINLSVNGITMKSIDALKSHCKRLRLINTNRCKNIPAGVVNLTQ